MKQYITYTLLKEYVYIYIYIHLYMHVRVCITMTSRHFCNLESVPVCEGFSVVVPGHRCLSPEEKQVPRWLPGCWALCGHGGWVHGSLNGTYLNIALPIYKYIYIYVYIYICVYIYIYIYRAPKQDKQVESYCSGELMYISCVSFVFLVTAC